jgi:hypothetical protein
VATFNKYNFFIDEISKGGHNFQASPVLKGALTNTAPDVTTQTVWNTTVAPEPVAAVGYTAGGNTLTISSATTTAGVFKLVLADTTFTAGAGSIGPFRYFIIYNSSATNKLIGYYDYGSSITLATTETFTPDFDPSTGALTIT